MEIEKEFLAVAKKIFENAKKEKRLIYNPSQEELKEFLKNEKGVKKTRYGNWVVETEPTSRAEMFTRNNIDNEFGEEELLLLSKCENILAKEELISIDRRVGKSKRIVRLITPKKYAHLAYELSILQLPPLESKEPNYWILIFTDESFEKNISKPLHEKDITIRIAFLENEKAIKIVRNSTYFGEVKKGIFAFEDWFAKKRGIFLHAACREDFLQQVDGSYKNVRSLIIGLSGNGKTTLACKILARKENEKSWLIQDDGGTLHPSGIFEGFEAGGLFVKTECVHPGEQIEIYYALLKPNTLMENVHVSENNDLDFFNLTKTSNGRAIIRREDLMHASSYIQVPSVENFFLITRCPLIPAISKLNLEQAVAFLSIGMAMETSAGNPMEAGKIRNQFFYDPFFAGNKGEHANRFYEICKKLDIDFYLLNTGEIGEGKYYKDISVTHTVNILDSLLRGGLSRKEDWVDSPIGFKVPVAVRNVDPIYFHPEKLYSKTEYEEKKREFFEKCKKILEEIEGLNPKIKAVFE